MKILKTILILFVSMAMTVVQVEAAFPTMLIDFEDSMDQGKADSTADKTDSGETSENAPAEDVFPADETSIESETLEETESALEEELPVDNGKSGFWTKKKSLGLLLLLMLIGGGVGIIAAAAGGGGGGGGGEGGGPGGGGGGPGPEIFNPVTPIIPGGPIPHHNPEPSTLTLLGLGLLLPFLRKRKS